jgi:CRISPR-associated protein Cmr4
MKQKLLYLFTRTPLHVGAGASVGAIDQPIIRERHTGFPTVPASSLKGSFSDEWNSFLHLDGEKKVRVKSEKDGETVILKTSIPSWLFGSDHASHSFAGAIRFIDAKLLAFPVRSAKGGFAWLTCPLMLRRAARDGVVKKQDGTQLNYESNAFAGLLGVTGDGNALFAETASIALPPTTVNATAGITAVLEEYTFKRAGDIPAGIVDELKAILPDEPVWEDIGERLIILSDGMMSFFAQNSCEVAQHVKIDDETGTAADQALFNQENVPSETLFYSIVQFLRGQQGTEFKTKTPEDTERAFRGQAADGKDDPTAPGVRNSFVFQFGGDASTGLGYCSIRIA